MASTGQNCTTQVTVVPRWIIQYHTDIGWCCADFASIDYEGQLRKMLDIMRSNRRYAPFETEYRLWSPDTNEIIPGALF